MKKLVLFFAIALLLLGCGAQVNAQGTAINTNGANPDNSALLDLSSTAKGQLLPRMTTTQRNLIVSPAHSLLIFNITTDCYEGYNANLSQWVSFGCIGCILPGAFSASSATAITQTSFSVNWTASSGATTYYLDVATDAAFTGFVPGYNNLNVGNVQTQSVASLQCNTMYYYRVRASNSCGTSANSNTVSVKTSTCWSCGSPITDSRDSKVYNTVLIGSQCWMKQNLDFGTFVTKATGQGAGGTQKYCQNDDQNNCTTYGGLYEWDEIMYGSSSCNGTGASQPGCTVPVPGICPQGWHLPSHYEITKLERKAGADSLSFPYDMSTMGWLGSEAGGHLKEAGYSHWTSPNVGATNLTGFTFLPGGNVWSGSWSGFLYWGDLWSCTEQDATRAWRRDFGYDHTEVYRDYAFKTNHAFSVRCIKD